MMIAFVSFCLFIKVELTNYISFQLFDPDDCVRLVNISNQILFNFTPLYDGHCNWKNYSMYPEDNYLVKNYEYEFKIAVEIIFEDWHHVLGCMNTDVYFNEFKIKSSDQILWRCINCGNGYKGYYWENDKMCYYSGEGDRTFSEKLYYFVFQIDNITDLYKGGAKGALEIIYDFYTFTDKDTFEREIYSTENELELINFNDPEILHVKSNNSLPLDYNYYYFKIEYEHNNVKGNLKGLDLDGQEKNLYSGYNFTVTDTSGLKYVLNGQEKENKYTEVRVRISVCNYCENGVNGYKCNNNTIVQSKEFIFKIKIIDPPTTIPLIPTTNAVTEKPSTTPVTEKLSTTPVTEKPSSSDTSENISKDTSNKNSDIISSEVIFDCLDNYFSHDKQNDIYSHLCPDFSKDDIKDNLNFIVQKIDNNTNYKIIGKDFIAQITPLDYLNDNITNNTDIFSSSSYTNFTECEKILRESNEYYSPRKITFVQIQLNNTNDDILVNQIEYQAYDDTNNPLNLSVCENTTIKTYYAIKNNTKEEVDLISLFKKDGIDILDLNDKFFNDVCLPYSDSNNDLTLNDRIKDIYKNYIFCEKNCKLVEIIYEEYKAVCNCTIKENINSTDFNFNLSKIQTEKKNNNFKIIKCHNSFTSIKDNLGNIGFWIFLGLMLLNIILLFLYIYGLKTIQNYITREMAKHGYIGKSDESHAFCHNYIKKLDKLILRLNEMKSGFIKKVVKAPPKHKTRVINLNNKSERTAFNSSIKKLNTKNNKQSLEKNIELLKSRMNKTKKIIKNPSSDTLERLNDKQLKLSAQNGSNNINEQNNFKLNLMNININDIRKKTYIPNLSDQILNIYNFQEALKYDKRSFFTIYYIFLIAKQVIMHAIFYRSPIEPLPIRLSLLKFMLGCDLALNAIFYTDDKVSEKYNSTKSLITFAFTNNLIVILLSTLIGYVMFIFLGNSINSTNQIRNLFREEEEKIKNNKNYKVSLQRKKEIVLEVKRIMRNYKIKIIIFYIIEFVCMIFFWYYVTIFCNIYKKTQLSWLIDSILTIIIRIIIDFFSNMLLALLYRCSIGFKINCLFRIIIFLYCFS